MDLRAALKEQYHAGLAMLAECIDKCPDDLWTVGHLPRSYWRIVWHTLYFTHNYLVQTADEFNQSLDSWPTPIRAALQLKEGQDAVEVEPYEVGGDIAPLTNSEMLEYVAYVDSLVDLTLDSLDLDRADTGFSWYPGMTKLSHELMNLRHLQGHVGQLSELLMAKGIDIQWAGKAESYSRFLS